MGRKIQITVVLSLMMACLAFGWAGSAAALTNEQQLLSEAWRIVNRAYLDATFNHQNWWFVRQQFLKQALPTRDATYQAIRTMLASLEDPYTRLLPPVQYRSLQTNTAGALTGVGLQIAKDEQGATIQVIAPVDGSPAAAAHLLPRDRILAIDGIPTRDLTLDEAASYMRGPVGSAVTLTYVRNDQAPAEVTLVRAVVNLNPVTAKLMQPSDQLTVGYIRLSQFNANAVDEVTAAVNQFEQAGANAYILDLRNNPGGLLSAGINLARLWLEAGTVVYTVDRGGVLDSYEAYGPALTSDPLIILVNEGTASASEILAGALQDNHRATLVGTTTFGKGLIQSLFDLSDGSGLVVTVAKYETPAHHDINHSGIYPDYRVVSQGITRDQVGTEQDSQFSAAIAMLTESLAQSTVAAGVP